ncbi:MAG: hypothetical protein ACRDXX_03300 [Stackebrandtia sp.]
MAGNTSKTARASVRAGQQAGQSGGLSVLGEYKYLIPLNKGKHAYVRNLVTGKTVHCATDSERFAEEIKTLAENGHGERIRAELDSFVESYPDQGWGDTAKRLDEAGAFGDA